MADVLIPHILRDDALLTPEMINENFRRVKEQQRQTYDRRWTFDTMVVPFKAGATEATESVELQALINPPFPCRVVGRELYVYADETMKLSVKGIADDLEAAGAGSTELAIGRDTDTVFLGVSDDLIVSLTSDAASWTLTAGWAVIHLAYDRHEGAALAGTYTPVLSSDTGAAAATKVNNALTSLAADTTAMAAATKRHAISCIRFGSEGFSSVSTDEQDIPLPDDTEGGILSIHICGVWDAALTVTATLYDYSAKSLGAAAATGGGTSTLVDGEGSLEVSMANQEADAADDWYIRISLSGSGDCYGLYVFVIWE